MAWYRVIWLGCNKATFLMNKREEGEITFIEKIQLRLHLRICDYCTRFQKQVKFFTGNVSHMHEHIQPKMSDAKKQAINNLLKK